jgi:hypothetical protein
MQRHPFEPPQQIAQLARGRAIGANERNALRRHRRSEAPQMPRLKRPIAHRVFDGREQRDVGRVTRAAAGEECFES